MSVCRVTTGLILLLALAACVHAAEAERRPASSLPNFHRLFLPADEIDRRIWKQRYLPVDAEEFERDLRVVADRARGAPAESRPRLQSARYTAQIVDEDVLIGSVRFEIAEGASKPAVLGLNPCSAALESANWLNPTRPATMGVDSDGRLQVLAEGTQLECRWSQRGQRTASGAVQFNLALPPCALARLELTAPAGAEIHVEGGIASKHTDEMLSRAQWTIELGGRGPTTLRVVPREASGDRRPLTLLRQTTTYEFTPRGINVGTQLRLDVHGEPLQRLALEVDPSLSLVSARSGETRIPWSVAKDIETGASQVILEFSTPLSGTGRVLQLSSVAPLVTGKTLTLPAVRPAGVAWQEGTASLLIPSGLVLEQLKTTGCRQSRVTALPAPLAGESIEIQFFEAAGTIEALVAEPRQRLELRHAAQFEIAADEIRCLATLDFASAGATPRSLSFPVLEGWVIDSVETGAGGVLPEWEVHAESNPAELRIERTTAERLVVRGHTSLPEQQPFSADRLRMLDLDANRPVDDLVSLRTVDGLDLRWKGAELPEQRLPSSLTAQQAALFAGEPSGPVFVGGDRFRQASLSVTRQKPNYTADIQVDVLVQKAALTETFSVLCTPAGSRVDRLLIQLSQPREEPVTWSLAGGNTSGEFSARRLSEGEQAKLGLRPEGEVWELLLELSRPGAFELRGQRRVTFTEETPVALASVQDAVSQRGTLAIRAIGDTGLTIHNRGLTSVPAELLDDDRYQTARAAYHYQPAGSDVEAKSVVSLLPAVPKQAGTGAWCWSLELDSRLAGEGHALHQATLDLQTAGQRELQLTLPADAEVTGVWLNATPQTVSEQNGTPARVHVELPPGRSRARVTLRFTTPFALPSLAKQISPPFPELDVPVVQQTWSVWLPPGYRAADAPSWLPASQLARISWSQRLFGILGRGVNQHFFNPLVQSDWSDTFTRGTSAESARNAQEQLFSNLGVLIGEYQDAEDLTWGQLLSAVAELEAQAGSVLLVDPQGLAESNITPLTRTRTATGSTPGELGRNFIADAGLLVVATPGRVALTSAKRVALYDHEVLSVGSSRPVGVAHGALAEEIRQAPATAGSFETVAIWLHQADQSQTVSLASGSWQSLHEGNGWRRYEFPAAAVRAGGVRIVHSARMQSMGWAILLAVSAVALWRGLVPASWLMACVGLLAALALVVPESFAPLASAALLGAVFGLLARLLPARATEPLESDPATTRSSHSGLAQAARVVLIAAALTQAGAALDAAEPSEGAGDEGESLLTVLVPIDAENSTGEKVYVPEPLLESLLRQAAIASGRPGGWIFLKSEYQGALSRDPVSSRTSLGELQARFEVHVFSTSGPVSVPLAQDAWQATIASARLDSRPLTPRWSPDGSLLLLGNIATGTHTLELELRTQPITDSARMGIELPIPRIPQTTLKLVAPQEIGQIQVPAARGRVSYDAQRGTLQAQLGASDRLSIRWPSGEAPRTASPTLEVEEFLWVRVRPGTTVVDARFKYRVLSGRVQTLRLLTDPRLRLLTSPAAGAAIAAVHTIPGDPQQVEFELAQPVSDNVTLDLSFLVTDASGVGNLRLPRLESAEAKSIRRWLGVSVDPALQYRIQAGEDSPAVDVAAFLESWGIGDAKPLGAYAIPRGEPIWFLATQPGKPQVAVDQTTAISLGRLSAAVQFEASLDISSGVLAQLNMQVPKGFKTQRVSVREQDVERVARWSVDESGRISIFLTAPIEGRQQVSLEGRWQLPEGDSFELPRWSLSGVQVSRNQWEIYRQPEVLLTVQDPPGARAVEVPESSRRPNLGALAAAFVLDRPDEMIRLERRANDPQVRAVAATLLRRERDDLYAELDCQVEVTDGLVDALRFEIPAHWSEPFRVEPAALLQVTAIPGQQRRLLTLTPAMPLAGTHRFRIEGRIAPSPGDRLMVPEIRILNIADAERYVALPRILDSQPVTWDKQRLSEAKLPPGLIPRDWQADAWDVYAVTGDDFQASLKAVDRGRAAAVVRLADIHLAWLPDGGYQAAAAFDIEPGGMNKCLLELPPGCELLNATVERLPAALESAGDEKFQLSLGPQRLPQRVELLYVAPRASTEDRQVYEAPRLFGQQPLQSLWTIYHPPQFMSRPSEPRLRVSPVDQSLIRLSDAARLIELPPEVLGEYLPEEIARWYDIWRRRYWSERDRFNRDLLIAGRDLAQSEESAEARALDQKMAAMDDRFGASRAGTRFVPQASIASTLAQSVGRGRDAEHYLLRPNDPPLRVSYTPITSDHLLGRWLAALGLASLGIAAAWGMQGRRLPHVEVWKLAAILAVACWFFLGPSVWGLLALVAIGFLGLWSRVAGPQTTTH